MRFFVYTRQTIRSIAPAEPHIIISIADREDRRPKLPNNPSCQGILCMTFHDVDERHTRHDPAIITLFNDKMANEILDFWQKHLTVNSAHVHCDGGQCRSPGVAAALQRLETGNDDVWFATKNPNRLVYRTILNEGYRRCLNIV